MPTEVAVSGTWNQFHWNDGTLWGPAVSPVFPMHRKPNKKKLMKRQYYFPRSTSQRPEWFLNYAQQLNTLGAGLGLPPADVADSVADALFLAYVTGNWITVVREFGPACTAAIDTLFDIPGVDPFVLPTFVAPPLPGAAAPLPATVPVPPGALQRIFAFVQTIKSRPEYTEEIGLQLGIVGAEDTAVHSAPSFTTKVEQGPTCQCVRFNIRKYEHEGVALESKRGNGDWEPLAVIMSGTYVDARPLLVAGVPEVRQYRMRFYDDAAPNGDYTDVTSLNVGP